MKTASFKNQMAASKLLATNSKPYLFCHPTELVCIQKGVLVALDQHHKQERSMLMQLLNRCRQDKAASKILQTVSSEVMNICNFNFCCSALACVVFNVFWIILILWTSYTFDYVSTGNNPFLNMTMHALTCLVLYIFLPINKYFVYKILYKIYFVCTIFLF